MNLNDFIIKKRKMCIKENLYIRVSKSETRIYNTFWILIKADYFRHRLIALIYVYEHHSDTHNNNYNDDNDNDNCDTRTAAGPNFICGLN